jgi:hypothetical protein
MTNKWRDFEYFGWDEDPIGKYTQPKKNPRFTKGPGYPSDEVDREGTKTYGRWMDGKGGKKERMEIRGCKNTERGKRFYVDEEFRSAAPETDGKRNR